MFDVDQRRGLTEDEKQRVNTLLGTLSDEWFVGYNGQRYWAFKYKWHHSSHSLGGETLDELLPQICHYEGVRLIPQNNC